MSNVARTKGEVTVDERGRVFGLQRIRAAEHRHFTRYAASEDEHGTITLVPLVSVPVSAVHGDQP